jgi:CBS-domain-containing membrane protein
MGRFHLIDRKFRQDPSHYILQALLAFVVVGAIVLLMGTLTRGALVAALGASAFVVFAMPDSKTATPRSLIGGHALCMAIGSLCSIPLRLGLVPSNSVSVGLLGAAAVSLALFGMVVTDTEHPPAAGNALAFAVAPIGLEHALFTAGTIVLLALARHALRGWLRDLT